MQKLNPAWVAHNDLYNEGGEGYNPHPKFICAQPVAPSGAARVIRGKRRTHAEAVRFANAALAGADKARFMAEVKTAFPELY